MPDDLKALVVDDHDHVRTFMVVLVRKIVSGPVIEARNGEEAVEAYRKHRPDLVLLDVNMPIMDGMEALRLIREINPDAVVIMITSLAMRRVVETALQGGAAGFIRKDTPRNQMVELINEVIALHLKPSEPSAGTAPSGRVS